MMNLVTENGSRNREISPNTGIEEESTSPSQKPTLRESETPDSRFTDPRGTCKLGAVPEAQPLSDPLSMSPALSVTDPNREDELHPRLESVFGRHLSSIVNQTNLNNSGLLPRRIIDTTEEMRRQNEELNKLYDSVHIPPIINLNPGFHCSKLLEFNRSVPAG